MASPSRTAEREEERRHNLRTLVIASAASATAALLTSQLWIAGTWIAAAMTPVIVTLVSELLHRPAEKIARSITSDRRGVARGLGAATPPAQSESGPPLVRVPGERSARPGQPPAGAPPFDRAGRRPSGPEPIRPPGEPGARGPGPDAPVRVYRAGGGAPPSARRRKIAFGAVFGMAGLAFVIAVVSITATELIAGESVGKNDGRTTLLGGKSRNSGDRDTAAPQETTPEQTTTPEEEQQQPEQSEPEPTTPTEQQETTPTEEAPPEEQTTETTPAPGEPTPQRAPTPETGTQP
jgi:hypothetical protein